MQRNLLPVPARALAIGAHPDDVEFGCGATLAKWAASGCEVHLVVCTDGSKGSWNPDADLAELVARRQQEATEAARALGAADNTRAPEPGAADTSRAPEPGAADTTAAVTFLGWVDGEVELGRAGVEALAAQIRRVRPEVVLTHDPWKRYRFHPDHRNVGWLALDAVVAARDPHFFADQGLDHHRPRALLLFEADEPDHLEDVGGFVDAKVAALLAHRSQYESTMGIADPEDAGQLTAFRHRILDRTAETGRPHGVAHAETFKLMTP